MRSKTQEIQGQIAALRQDLAYAQEFARAADKRALAQPMDPEIFRVKKAATVSVGEIELDIAHREDMLADAFKEQNSAEGKAKIKERKQLASKVEKQLLPAMLEAARELDEAVPVLAEKFKAWTDARRAVANAGLSCVQLGDYGAESMVHRAESFGDTPGALALAVEKALFALCCAAGVETSQYVQFSHCTGGVLNTPMSIEQASRYVEARAISGLQSIEKDHDYGHE